MASNYWAKLYIEMLDDAKVARLSDRLWRRFVECILLAKELDKDGALPPLGDMAWRLRADDDTLTSELAQLVALGILTAGETWAVTNFTKRQGPTEPAERMRRMRNSKQQREYYGSSDTPVTDAVTQPVTNRNAETDTEKEKMYTRACDDAMPRYEAPDPERQRLVTAISEVVKETFWEKTEDDFFAAADAFQRDGVTVEHIRSFPAWWKHNSYYNDSGQPALKSLVDEMKNCRAGVNRKARANGQDKRLNPDVDDIPERVGGVF